MSMINVIDYKNDEFNLTWSGRTSTSKQGLIEMWFWCDHKIKALKNYSQIPIPVFTNWF